MISSVKTGVQNDVFPVFCSVLKKKKMFLYRKEKLTQDGKLKICSDDPPSAC